MDLWHLLRNGKWWLTPAVSQLEAVFVVGAPRSGTTLIQRVLAAHPDFFSIPSESGIFTLQDMFDPARKHFGLRDDTCQELLRQSGSHVEFFDRAVRALPEGDTGRVFVEKTPQHAFRTGFILARFPRARVVSVVRDGRDCYCSSQANPAIPQRRVVKQFAQYWRRSIRSVDTQSIPGRVFEIRYEDFVRGPESCLERVMDFLGHKPVMKQLDPSELGNDPRSGRREFERLSSAIDSRSVGQWRTKMDPISQETFLRVAARELASKGYA